MGVHGAGDGACAVPRTGQPTADPTVRAPAAASSPLSATRPASSRAPCLENARTATHRVCASPSPTSCRASWGPAGWSPPPLPALPFPRARGTEGHRPIFIARWRFCGKPDDICSAVHCLFTLHVREQEAAGPPAPGLQSRLPASVHTWGAVGGRAVRAAGAPARRQARSGGALGAANTPRGA